MMLTILCWVYWIVFALSMFFHLCSGSFLKMGYYKWRGRVIFRFPGLFAALILSGLWPIILPFQLAKD